MKIKLALIIALILVPTISAQQVQDLGTFEPNICIMLKQQCNCTSVNISTMLLPDGSEVRYNPEAIFGAYGKNFNYTYCPTQRGTYIVSGHGDDDGIDTPFSYTFTVASSWQVPIWLWIIAVLLLLIGLLAHNPYLGLFSGFSFVTGGIYIMINGLGILTNNYTRIIAFLSLGLGLTLAFVSVVGLFSDAYEEED